MTATIIDLAEWRRARLGRRIDHAGIAWPALLCALFWIGMAMIAAHWL